MLALDVGHGLGAERVLPGEQVIEHDAERVDVGALVDGVAADLLGRHGVRRAEPRADHGQPGLGGVGVQELGDAEVEQLDHALGRGVVAVRRSGGDEDVAGLEIAVDDAARVRRLERRADRLQVLEHLGRRDAPLVVEHAAQVGALEQLHHVERPPVGQLAELVDVDDVRVLDHVDRQRLAQEARDHLGRARQLATQDLDRRATAEQPVLGLVDRAAAARGELSLQNVRARERPRSQSIRIDRLRERSRLIRAEGSGFVEVFHLVRRTARARMCAGVRLSAYPWLSDVIFERFRPTRTPSAQP